jgi:hypothetical protein
MPSNRRSHAWLRRALGLLPNRWLAGLDAWSAGLAQRRADQRRRARTVAAGRTP